MKRDGIQRKVLSAILVTTIVALLVSSTAMVAYNLSDYRARTTQELITQVNLLGRAVTPALQFNDPDSARTYLKYMENQPAILAAAIYTEKGTLFAGYNLHNEAEGNLAKLPKTDGSRVDGNSLIVYDRLVANDEILGFVFVRMRYEFYAKLFGNLTISIGVIVIALAVASLVSWRLQRSITLPLKSISDLSKQLVETNDFSLRVKAESKGEIGFLESAFNEMLDEVEHQKKALEVINENLGNEVKTRKKAEQALKKSEENIRQLNSELEQRVIARTSQLEIANKELESFSYSVSHDLRTPLRAIDGFSQALLEDYEAQLDEAGKNYLARVRSAAQRMGELIDDMLKLSRVTRAEMNFRPVDLSAMAKHILKQLAEEDSQREVDVFVTSGLMADCDTHLIKIALTNLLHNAWKYSSKVAKARIEFGLRQHQGEPVFFIQDNGVGFDMAYADKLFGAFQRLHSVNDFPGSGIGLATVKRVVSRHGGRVWAESSPNEGAAFYFTLPAPDKIDKVDTISKIEMKGEANEQQTHSAG